MVLTQLTVFFCIGFICNSAYPQVHWRWVRWSFYILPQFCRSSRWSEHWCRWLAQALLLLHPLRPLGTVECWVGSGGRTGLDLQFEDGEWCHFFWGSACVIGPWVCPVLSPLLSPRPRHTQNEDCCELELITLSVLWWKTDFRWSQILIEDANKDAVGLKNTCGIHVSLICQ